eukprot:tig00021493_g21865.t1
MGAPSDLPPGFKSCGVASVRGLKDLECFEHESGMRFVLQRVEGPLCAACIVFSTEASDNKGLPHTLEHLVFMGSESIPYKGHLDTLATRCLSNGTNAWTAPDHTAYTVTTAGAEGMVRLLPTFMDHLLRPTLTDEAFATEVYHVNAEGQQAGVVFCEMQGRETTEDDLSENALRALVFPDSGYCYEAGGLTPDIARLTNAEVRAYHAAHYRPANCTVILQGVVEPRLLFEALAKYEPSPLAVPARPGAQLAAPWSRPLPPLARSESRVVPFPAEDASVGAWPSAGAAPALTTRDRRRPRRARPAPRRAARGLTGGAAVLCRYLSETAASALSRRFVERAVPLAAEVAFDSRSFAETALELHFAGVPAAPADAGCCHDHDHDHDDEEEEDGEGSEDEGTRRRRRRRTRRRTRRCGAGCAVRPGGRGAASGAQEAAEAVDAVEFGADLLQPGALLGRALRVLRAVRDGRDPARPGAFLDLQAGMLDAIARHRLKFTETVEDDPYESVQSLLIPDILFGARPAWAARVGRQVCLPSPALGAGAEAGPAAAGARGAGGARGAHAGPDGRWFWASLLDRWMISAPVAEVIMRPDPALAERAAAAEARPRPPRPRRPAHRRAEGAPRGAVGALGPAGLAARAAALEAALERNAPPQAAAAGGAPGGAAGPPPRAEAIPRLPRTAALLTLPPSGPAGVPVQVIRCGTRFAHVRLVMETGALGPEARRRLPLFKALLFATAARGEGGRLEPHSSIVAALARDLVSHGCSLGVGGRTFGAALLPDTLAVYACAEPAKFPGMLRWLVRLLKGAAFPRHRLLATASSLLTEAVEAKRDGAEMADAILTAALAPEGASCDRPVALFAQEPFLRQVKAEVAADLKRHRAAAARGGCCGGHSHSHSHGRGGHGHSHGDEEGDDDEEKEEKDDGGEAGRELERVRGALLADPQRVFLQVAVPSEAPDPVPETLALLLAGLAAPRPDERPKARAPRPKGKGKERAGPDPAPAFAPPPLEAHFARPYAVRRCWYDFSRLGGGELAVLVPIRGVEGAYLNQSVPCPVDRRHEDYHALATLCELLSRTEGPLYARVRGAGLAYGAHVELDAWRGQLLFSLYESSAPHAALAVFGGLLGELEALLTEEEAATARAAVLFKAHEARATAPLLIRRALLSFFQGFETLEGEEGDEARLEAVGVPALRRALETHLSAFLRPASRATVVTCSEAMAAEVEKGLLAAGLPLERRDLKSFAPPA